MCILSLNHDPYETDSGFFSLCYIIELYYVPNRVLNPNLIVQLYVRFVT